MGVIKFNDEEFGGGASNLSGLSDVSISSATNGQVLKYDSANSVWKNANESGGGGGGVTADTLYTGNTIQNSISLSHAYTDYDYILISFTTDQVNPGFHNSTLLKASEININDYVGCSDDAYYIWYQVTSTTQLDWASSNGAAYFITSVVGFSL